MQKTEPTLIQTYVRMPQYVVYAIEKYLAISDNTCRTQGFIVPHKVQQSIT